ncbi:putative sMC domain protein [Burkholderia pseudomallei TSV28]|nr:putative sMC domain protein [Burkholderia pseudomallei TSV28]
MSIVPYDTAVLTGDRDMRSAKQDYARFLRWLHEPERGTSENIRRFANMVLAEFDAIAATSQQRNARAAALARLATTPLGRPHIEAHAAVGEWPWRRLRELTMGPFRGFRREERFDLRKRVVLFSTRCQLRPMRISTEFASLRETVLKPFRASRYPHQRNPSSLNKIEIDMTRPLNNKGRLDKACLGRFPQISNVNGGRR